MRNDSFTLWLITQFTLYLAKLCQEERRGDENVVYMLRENPSSSSQLSSKVLFFVPSYTFCIFSAWILYLLHCSSLTLLKIAFPHRATTSKWSHTVFPLTKWAFFSSPLFQCWNYITCGFQRDHGIQFCVRRKKMDNCCPMASKMCSFNFIPVKPSIDRGGKVTDAMQQQQKKTI